MTDPTIQSPAGPAPDATGDILVSLAEIDAMGRKAARGAGYAWGMAEEEALVTSARMVEADLRGIDSHGIFMLPAYDEWRRKGMLNMSAKTTVVRETGGTARLDAEGGLGHDPATRAAHMAIEKAQAHGVSVVTVRNSQHYGAAGVYAIMAAEAGLIGMSSSTHLA